MDKQVKRRKITFRVPVEFYEFLEEYAQENTKLINVNMLCRLVIARFFTKKAIRPSSYYLGKHKDPTCYHCEEWEMNDHGEHSEPNKHNT